MTEAKPTEGRVRPPKYTRAQKRRQPWEDEQNSIDLTPKIPQAEYYQVCCNGWYDPGKAFYDERRKEAAEKRKESGEKVESEADSNDGSTEKPGAVEKLNEKCINDAANKGSEKEDDGDEEEAEKSLLHYPEDDEDPTWEDHPPLETSTFYPRLGVYTYKAQAKQIKKQMFTERRIHKRLYKRWVYDILEYYETQKPKQHTIDTKMNAMKALKDELEIVFPLNSLRIFPIGASADGCGSDTTALECTLVIDEPFPADMDDRPIRRDLNQSRDYVTDCLSRITRHLAGRNLGNRKLKFLEYGDADDTYDGTSEIVMGPELPHVRLSYYPSGGDGVPINLRTGTDKVLPITLFINDIASIYNAHLIYNYTKVDKRFAQVAVTIKGWAANNLASKQGPLFLTGTNLCHMVIHYMQCCLEPPVLPNLHHLYPKMFGKDALLWESDLQATSRIPTPEWRNNGTPIHEQIVGFFHYYSNLDYRRKAISIKDARILPKSSVPDRYKSHIAIVDAYTGTNSCRVVSGPLYRKIVSNMCIQALSLSKHPVMQTLLAPNDSCSPNTRGQLLRVLRHEHITNCGCRLPGEEDNSEELDAYGNTIPNLTPLPKVRPKDPSTSSKALPVLEKTFIMKPKKLPEAPGRWTPAAPPRAGNFDDRPVPLLGYDFNDRPPRYDYDTPARSKYDYHGRPSLSTDYDYHAQGYGGPQDYGGHEKHVAGGPSSRFNPYLLEPPQRHDKHSNMAASSKRGSRAPLSNHRPPQLPQRAGLLGHNPAPSYPKPTPSYPNPPDYQFYTEPMKPRPPPAPAAAPYAYPPQLDPQLAEYYAAYSYK
ncbi:unnamed protein product, partial [Mesorhabditis spiculigera]